MNSKQQLVLKDEKEEQEKMQGITNISGSHNIRSNSIKRTPQSTAKTNIGLKKSGASIKQGYSYDFLNTDFSPISKIQVDEIHEIKWDALLDISKEQMIDKTLACVLNFAKIRKVEIDIPVLNTLYDKAIFIGATMDKLLKPDYEFWNIEHNYVDDIHLVIFSPHYSWDSTLHFIPLEPLYLLKDVVSKKLHTLLVKSMALLVQNACIPKYDEGFMEVVLQVLADESEENLVNADDEYEREYMSERIACVQSYTSYEASKYLGLMKQKNLDKNEILLELNKLKVRSPFAKSIKQIAFDALNLVQPGENLHNYDYNPYQSEYDEAVTIERLITLTWDDFGDVCNSYLDWVNMDGGEFGSLVPYSNVKVTAHSIHDIERTDWPDRLHSWVENYNNILSVK